MDAQHLIIQLKLYRIPDDSSGFNQVRMWLVGTFVWGAENVPFPVCA